MSHVIRPVDAWRMGSNLEFHKRNMNPFEASLEEDLGSSSSFSHLASLSCTLTKSTAPPYPELVVCRCISASTLLTVIL